MTELAPIALFTYNRPWHTRQTVEALAANILAEKSDLIVFSDGPKNDNHLTKVSEVRAYLGNVTGFRSVRLVFREKNLGLANSIIAGVTDLVNEFGRVIVMEDDMVTSPHFLTFLNDGLRLYADTSEVACIHGYRYPLGAVDAPFFIRGADCWGWGTWKRAWDEFEPDAASLLNHLETRGLIADFNHSNSFPYDKMLRDQRDGKVDSWAIRWKASAFLKGRYTLYPRESLLRNIGNDDSGTHSQTTTSFDVDVAREYVPIAWQQPAENPSMAARVADFYKKTKPTFAQRVVAKLKSIRNG